MVLRLFAFAVSVTLLGHGSTYVLAQKPNIPSGTHAADSHSLIEGVKVVLGGITDYDVLRTSVSTVDVLGRMYPLIERRERVYLSTERQRWVSIVELRTLTNGYEAASAADEKWEARLTSRLLDNNRIQGNEIPNKDVMNYGNYADFTSALKSSGAVYWPSLALERGCTIEQHEEFDARFADALGPNSVSTVVRDAGDGLLLNFWHGAADHDGYARHQYAFSLETLLPSSVKIWFKYKGLDRVAINYEHSIEYVDRNGQLMPSRIDSRERYARKAEGATLPTLGHLLKEQTFTWIDDSSDIEAVTSISDLADLRKFNQLLRKTK